MTPNGSRESKVPSGTPGNEVFIPENPVNATGIGIATRISDRLS